MPKRLLAFLAAVVAVLSAGLILPSSASASTYQWSASKRCYWSGDPVPNRYVDIQVRVHTHDDGSRHADAVSWTSDEPTGQFIVDEINSAGTVVSTTSRDVNATSYTYYLGEGSLGTFRGTSVMIVRVRNYRQDIVSGCIDSYVTRNYGVRWTYSN